MRRRTLILCCVGCLALLTLIIIGRNYYVALKYSPLGSSSKAFVDLNTPIILSIPSRDELQRRSTKELNDAMTEQQWQLYITRIKKLGDFKKYEGCEGQSYISLSIRNGILFTASYFAYANYEHGPVTIRIGLIRRSKQWQINNFLVDSPIFETNNAFADNASIPAGMARDFVGKEAIVRGAISETVVDRHNTNVCLYLDGDIQHPQFSAVWLGTNNPPISRLKDLTGTVVFVRGKIIIEQGIPEIIVDSLNQISQ